jgi:hypothetical protein
LLVITFLAVLPGCDAKPTSQSDQAVSQAESQAASAHSVDCERDSVGQIACLTSAFNVTDCAGSQVLGSTFRSNPATRRYVHQTAFDVPPPCLEEIRDEARKRGYRMDGDRDLILETKTGYREVLTLSEPNKGAVGILEWERIQE